MGLPAAGVWGMKLGKVDELAGAGLVKARGDLFEIATKRSPLDSHHGRSVETHVSGLGSPNPTGALRVTVDNEDLVACSVETCCKVEGDRGFADPTLEGGHGDDDGHDGVG